MLEILYIWMNRYSAVAVTMDMFLGLLYDLRAAFLFPGLPTTFAIAGLILVAAKIRHCLH